MIANLCRTPLTCDLDPRHTNTNTPDFENLKMQVMGNTVFSQRRIRARARACFGVVVAMCVIEHMDKLQGRAQFLETATACGINDRYHPCCSDFTSSKLIRLSACACLYAAFMQLNYMDVNVGE